MSEHPPQHSVEPEHSGTSPARGGGRHELPPDEPAPEIGDLQAGGVTGVARRGRSQFMFGALAVLLCVLLGVAIVTQARQTESGDSLETARPADLLVLLSDIDGLYDAPPKNNPNAKLIPVVDSISSEIEAVAGDAESELSRGGMRTKVEAAKIATTGGTHMLIASGKIEHPLQAISDGGRCTWFLTPANPVTARKRWIAGSLEPKGTLTIDAGAVTALRAGKSLLPAGVIRVDGQFARGDAVVVRGPDTHEIGRGLVAYDAEDAEKIKGRSSPDVMVILGISGRAEMIHRDDLVVGG